MQLQASEVLLELSQGQWVRRAAAWHCVALHHVTCCVSQWQQATDGCAQRLCTMLRRLHCVQSSVGWASPSVPAQRASAKQLHIVSPAIFQCKCPLHDCDMLGWPCALQEGQPRSQCYTVRQPLQLYAHPCKVPVRLTSSFIRIMPGTISYKISTCLVLHSSQ